MTVSASEMDLPLNRSRWSYYSWMLRSTEEEVLITRLIEKAIRKSEAVDRESLCILAGEKVRIRPWRYALRPPANPSQRIYRSGQSG